MDNEYTVQDLISLSYDQKPVDFQQAFDALISSRIAAAIDNRKLEVAQSMFSDQAASEDYSEGDQELDQEEQTDGEAA